MMSAQIVTIARCAMTQKLSQNMSTRWSVIASNTKPPISEIDENGRSNLANQCLARSDNRCRSYSIDIIIPLFYPDFRATMDEMIDFQVIKKSRRSRARLGILQTPHGEVMTPA